MKAFILITEILAILICSGCSMAPNESQNKIDDNYLNKGLDSNNLNQMHINNYERMLNRATTAIYKGNNLTLDELLAVIPNNAEEYLMFYKLTDPDQGSSKQIAFDYIDDQMHDLAKNGNKEVLDFFLNLSAYIDGKYAEGYYANAEFIIRKNTKLFCIVVRSTNTEGKKVFL